MLSTAEPIKTKKKNDVKVINLKKGLIFYHLKWFALYVAILSFILLSVLHLGIRIITQDFIFHNAIEATVKKHISNQVKSRRGETRPPEAHWSAVKRRCNYLSFLFHVHFFLSFFPSSFPPFRSIFWREAMVGISSHPVQ